MVACVFVLHISFNPFLAYFLDWESQRHALHKIQEARADFMVVSWVRLECWSRSCRRTTRGNPSIKECGRFANPGAKKTTACEEQNGRRNHHSPSKIPPPWLERQMQYKQTECFSHQTFQIGRRHHRSWSLCQRNALPLSTHRHCSSWWAAYSRRFAHLWRKGAFHLV